ncbi:hypothetical protein L1987_27182 [Smallanthus sonchifolius]|uniref:Uncharacterized protein n=1 Tax=Smallanthus sonchifolius TaxID=185202 RepID=A0ACB9IAW5_9ASTR|nr:hypothetical protein L1987_27182 [Smallanthus sonchifolius]
MFIIPVNGLKAACKVNVQDLIDQRLDSPRLSGNHNRGKSQGLVNDLSDNNQAALVIQNSRWANLPPELLFDVIKRLEESESSWPARKHVVACAAVCRSWRSMCKEIVRNPESCGKLTFPVSMKQALLSSEEEDIVSPWPSSTSVVRFAS